MMYYHCEMKVWFVGFHRVRHECKLRDAKYLAIDIFDACFPHLGCRWIIEDA